VSLSALLTAIADGTLHVGPPFRFDEAHSIALAKAAAVLSVQGSFEEARLLCALLHERGTLSESERQRLRQLRLTAPEEWWAPLRQHIVDEKPFAVRGRDLQGVERSWIVRHATLSRFNHHGYLDLWAEEAEGNANNIEELAHNWVIPVAAVASVLPASGKWRDDFDRIEAVVFVQPFCGSGEAVGQSPPIEERRVMIHSAFHAVREWLGWGLPCEVASPASLQSYWQRQPERPAALPHQLTTTRGPLSRHKDQQTLRTWLVGERPATGGRSRAVTRSLAHDVPEMVSAATQALRPSSVPPVSGAGSPPVGNQPTSATVRSSFDEGVTAEIELQWVQTMTIRYRLYPSKSDGILILIFEEPDTARPLSAIGLPSSASEQTVTISAKELGFDPAGQPWRFWAVLT
jgi:hypothetical protein